MILALSLRIVSLCAYSAQRFFHLPEAVWILIPLPIIDGATFLSGKPVFHCLAG
jgi:hypothetical protein